MLGLHREGGSKRKGIRMKEGCVAEKEARGPVDRPRSLLIFGSGRGSDFTRRFRGNG